MTAQEAIALLRANPPDNYSPLPWHRSGDSVRDSDGAHTPVAKCDSLTDAAHIAAAVHAAPVLAAEVERLTADLAALRERLRWIPVGERLPDLGTIVDVWTSDRGRGPECDRVDLCDDGIVWADIHGHDLREWTGKDTVTHWRPIDAPE